MHFLQNLLNYMTPPLEFVLSGGEEIPAGTVRVITNTGAFVVTARSNFVIAKDYV